MSATYIETRDQINQLAQGGYLDKAYASFLILKLFTAYIKGEEPDAIINAVNAAIKKD